jgi:hypothetical protein
VKCCVRTSIHLEVDILDYLATHCELDSSGVIGAILLEHFRQGVLTTPAVIVAVTLKTLDCQACEKSRMWVFFTALWNILDEGLRT